MFKRVQGVEANLLAPRNRLRVGLERVEALIPDRHSRVQIPAVVVDEIISVRRVLLNRSSSSAIIFLTPFGVFNSASVTVSKVSCGSGIRPTTTSATCTPVLSM